jgi:hypothetical protein
MGFLDRLRGTPSVSRTTVTTTVNQRFQIKVPAANAPAVQHGLERWAQSKGWAAVVRAEGDGEFVKLSLEHDETLPGKPPKIEADSMTDELQHVLEDAMKR